MPVKWEDEKFLHAAEVAIECGLDDLVGKMVDSCRQSMKQGPQTGKDYRQRFRKEGKKRPPKGVKSNKRFYVRSSAPGEYPAVQTGGLWRSIAWARAGRFKRQFGTNSLVGLWQELGTKRGLAPRPFLRMTYRKFIGKEAEVHFHGKVK